MKKCDVSLLIKLMCVYMWINVSVLETFAISTHPMAKVVCDMCATGNEARAKQYLPKGSTCSDLSNSMVALGEDGCLGSPTNSQGSSQDFSTSEEARRYAIKQKEIADSAIRARNQAYALAGAWTGLFFGLIGISVLVYRHKRRKWLNAKVNANSYDDDGENGLVRSNENPYNNLQASGRSSSRVNTVNPGSANKINNNNHSFIADENHAVDKSKVNKAPKNIHSKSNQNNSFFHSSPKQKDSTKNKPKNSSSGKGSKSFFTSGKSSSSSSSSSHSGSHSFVQNNNNNSGGKHKK